MSRTKHNPHWNKTSGHGWWKRRLNKLVRRTPKTERPIIKKTGPG